MRFYIIIQNSAYLKICSEKIEYTQYLSTKSVRYFLCNIYGHSHGKKVLNKSLRLTFDSTQVLSLVKSLLNNCNRNEQGAWWAGKAWQPEGIRPVTHWEIFSTDRHDIFGQSICTHYSTFETCVSLWPWKNVGSKIYCAKKKIRTWVGLLDFCVI